ncbi:hypothetical protein CWI37_1985p0020 [Hamiltosporidium tvaerminnensis]|uniref:Uncharacterized protein n=1 Tax=Hamiltosporidium tvaerminnensis TaxID=1176355 RepID=A0A4Q9KTS0_9MICR|nr:hypothetical protein CWI37_1985p0020 [Hamiltosporidium tvaerminnensis]
MNFLRKLKLLVEEDFDPFEIYNKKKEIIIKNNAMIICPNCGFIKYKDISVLHGKCIKCKKMFLKKYGAIIGIMKSRIDFYREVSYEICKNEKL